jgi:catechol 2,3-dioxygenase-like lactoylglutathione lyase family enzyme
VSAPAELRFHHFGLAAADPARACAFVTQLGYRCSTALFDPLQNVHLQWCEREGTPPIEIVSPAHDGGPLTRILASQPSSFYHLCYEVDVVTADVLVALREGGARIVTVVEPLPAILFGGRRVSFHMVQGLGLIELLEARSVVIEAGA